MSITSYEFWPNRPPNGSLKKCFGELELKGCLPMSRVHGTRFQNMQPGLRLSIRLHHSACCSHHHGEGETALEPIRAGHSGDHATATSFCAISIHVFLPGLCPRQSGVWSHLYLITIWSAYSLCPQNRMRTCLATWVSLLSSWAACLTKLHKAYFSNRFFAPVRTRSLGGTSSNMARSVSISAMLRHLLGTRGTNVEYLKLVTMMMVNDKILAALWWNHHLDCLRKKTSFSVENWVSRFPGPRFSCFARCFASSTRTKLKRSRSGRSLPSSVPSCFMMAVPSTTWTWTSA